MNKCTFLLECPYKINGFCNNKHPKPCSFLEMDFTISPKLSNQESFDLKKQNTEKWYKKYQNRI